MLIPCTCARNLCVRECVYISWGRSVAKIAVIAAMLWLAVFFRLIFLMGVVLIFMVRHGFFVMFALDHVALFLNMLSQASGPPV